ncbi:monooxygenase, partial [Streptomyces sp. NPDC002920]
MRTPHKPPAPTTPVPDGLGFDPDALRAKYRAERDRRIRPDGNRQYRRLGGEPSRYAQGPYAEPGFTREPLHDRVEVAVVGGGFGSTWYWNRYPGVQCDIESYVYLPLLEEVGHIPEWRYAPGEEIRQHARAIGRHFDLYRDACFRHVVVSSGTLSLPKLPGIPGTETFQGHMFHTSRWDYAYTGGDANGDLHGLADKRVAVIGTGATAIRIVPHLGAARV